MKRLNVYLLILISCFSLAKNQRPIPQKPLVLEQDPDKEVNTDVIVSNVAGMLDGLGKIVPDPYNPVNVASSITQIGVSFAKIMVEIFKSLPESETRRQLTQEDLQELFETLPYETQHKLIELVIAYAQKMTAKEIA